MLFTILHAICKLPREGCQSPLKEWQKMSSRVAVNLLPLVASMKTKTTKRKFRLSPIVVSGAGFRCLAFRDAKGILRNFWNQAILPLPIHILDPEN